METINKKHCQMPHDMGTKEIILTPNDKYVYVAMRRHMDKDSNETFVSLDRLSRDTGLNKRTITKSIHNLLLANELSLLIDNSKKRNQMFINLLLKAKNLKCLVMSF